MAGRRKNLLQIKNYVKVKSLEEAYDLNQKKNSLVLGGMMWLKMSHRMIFNAIDLSDLSLNQIQEDEEYFYIGAMCTLRQLETHMGLESTFHGVIQESLKHIVGVQFRNGATVGGSVFGRFGFSDVITCLLCLDTYVELYQGGIIPLSEFVSMKRDCDILVRILIKKDNRKAIYLSQRKTATDLPIITCAVGETGKNWFISIGARPGCARQIIVEKKTVMDQVQDRLTQEQADKISTEIIKKLTFESNMRGSKEYRIDLAKIYTKRAILLLNKLKQIDISSRLVNTVESK